MYQGVARLIQQLGAPSVEFLTEVFQLLRIHEAFIFRRLVIRGQGHSHLRISQQKDNL
jgi:hypothetical protein